MRYLLDTLAETLCQWDAYPVLPPTDKFPPVKIDQGFYYVNAFEPQVAVSFSVSHTLTDLSIGSSRRWKLRPSPRATLSTSFCTRSLARAFVAP